MRTVRTTQLEHSGQLRGEYNVPSSIIQTSLTTYLGTFDLKYYSDHKLQGERVLKRDQLLAL
jgi:hypothetical protein